MSKRKKPMLKKASLLAVAAMLQAAPLLATHPLITDDTATQGTGKYQIELNGGYSTDMQTADGASVRAKSINACTTVTFGLSDGIDLAASLPWQWSRLEDGGNVVSEANGIGDFGVQLKWRILENRSKSLSFAVKPGVSLPSGNEGKGFGNGEVSGSLILIATGRNGTGALHANLGFVHNSYRLDIDQGSLRSDLWHASLAAELNMASGLRSVANIGIDTNQNMSAWKSPAFLIGGLVYSPKSNLDLDIGLKKGLNDASVDTTVLAGATARF